MSKRKRFGLSQNLSQGLREIVNAAENHANSARYEIIALTRIELDPENPRNLLITPEDISKGLSLADGHAQRKQEELEKLKGLAETIKSKGVINPIVVYKHSEKYRLVAGERRYLASLLAARDDIQAKILSEKPNGVDLRLLQWIENTEREDLTLKDRIGNVKAIIDEYKKLNDSKPITATLLKNLIKISLSQATAYMAVLNTSGELKNYIELGKINNLDKAAYIAKINRTDLRKKALEIALEGTSLKQVRLLVENEEKLINAKTITQVANTFKKRGRASTRVNMGTTTKPLVIRKLIQFTLSQPGYHHLSTKFDNIDWSNFEQSSKAFRSLISILEKETEKE